MATQAEQLILRGLHLILRATFSPNEQAAQAAHFVNLQRDIGPWFTDYAEEIAKPPVDGAPFARDPGDGSGAQS